MKKDILVMGVLGAVIAGLLIAIFQIDESVNDTTQGHHLTVIEKNVEAGVIEIRDDETGVHYLKDSDSISVMYNADGTIKSTK